MKRFLTAAMALFAMAMVPVASHAQTWNSGEGYRQAPPVYQGYDNGYSDNYYSPDAYQQPRVYRDDSRRNYYEYSAPRYDERYRGYRGNTARYVGGGAAAGAVIGALVGHAPGAALGALIGGTTGYLWKHHEDHENYRRGY
jgi:hypothetical protein